MPLAPVKNIIVGDRAEQAIQHLSSQGALSSLHDAIADALAALTNDGQHGDNLPIQRLRRSAAYRPLARRHDDPDNLYCIDLPKAWRLLYTIVRDGEDIFVVVLEIVDHKQYSRWFPGQRYK